MHPKKRYILLFMDGVDTAEEFESRLFQTLIKLGPLLPIRGNFRVIKETTKRHENGFVGVVSVSNKYKYDVIFLLSLIGKFYKSNVLTLKSSGSLKKVKKERDSMYGTDAK